MGNTIQEIEAVIEEVTGTTSPQASAGVLIDYIVNLLGNISTSADPATAADHTATALATHKDALAAAVAANP